MAKQISVNDYLDFINDTYPKAKYPQIGKIYVFGYLFNQSPTYDPKKVKETKFYDFYPCTFIYDINVKEHLFHGFNLHIVPPTSRNRWLQLMELYTEGKDLNPKKFMILKRLFRTSQFAIRQYYMRRVKNFREIPKTDWNTIMEKYANTSFGASTFEITAKYLSLIE